MDAPKLIYGTAWKQDETAALVGRAFAAGYRAIDTANQKKHYREDFVGDALLELKARREDLYLQSKYTYQNGQDHRLPYDPDEGFAAQVRSSFAGSLKNLHTSYLDSYLMHSLSSMEGVSEADWEAWGALEELQRSGQARSIGVSNVGLRQLRELHEKAAVKPAVVSNRCYALRGWDRGVREFCAAHGLVYQGFSLLTANPQVMGSTAVRVIAGRLRATPAQVVFRFAQAIGITPLTGTTDAGHMKEDLAALELPLSEADVAAILALREASSFQADNAPRAISFFLLLGPFVGGVLLPCSAAEAGWARARRSTFRRSYSNSCPTVSLPALSLSPWSR